MLNQLSLFCAEILAINIKFNNKIEPIPLPNGEQETLEQYADDTSIWLLWSNDSVNEIANKLENFYKKYRA